jgi:glycosyltransferase involved in cell wall biosynthesis
MNKIPSGNILLVSNYPSDVGYAWWLMEHFWTLLAERFDGKGAKTFLAYPGITTLPTTIENSSIYSIELPVPGKNQAERKAVCKFIADNHITDIYFTDRAWFSPDYALLRLWGVKNIVVHDHTPGDRPPIGGLKGTLKALRHRLPLFCANAQLCVSGLMRQRSITNGRIPANKCHVVQNGISPLTTHSEAAPSLRESMDIPPGSTVCITTGRAHPYKRFDFIIDVAAELNRKLPENKLVFLMVGNGPALDTLRNKAKELGLGNKVRLPGFRTDAKQLLATADIAIHAALGEGFSLSIIEYMSAGLPVLVPDIPSVKQAIDHRENGLVFGKNDVSGAARCLEELLQAPDYRKQLGANAKLKASTQYTLENCSKQFRAICQTLF